MLYGIIGILIVTIIILSIKLNKKVIIDNSLIEEQKSKKFKAELEVEKLQYQKLELEKDIKVQHDIIEDYNDKIFLIQDKYKKELNKKTDYLNQYFESQKLTRQSEMDTEFERLQREKEEVLKLNFQNLVKTYEAEEEVVKQNTEKAIAAALESQKNIIADTLAQQERFEGLLLPLKQYEMDKQERLFYTIQVPDEYKQDIDFLLTTVSQKVQHPDIINKLIWSEYVKPYIDQTFKRIGIEDKAGIYKITSLENGKSYIGKSTNVKKRLTDHFKSSVGIKTIADQTIHHEIWRSGFWNWTIEVIIYCDREQLSELEKYYIDFFKTQEFGYNKRDGG